MKFKIGDWVSDTRKKFRKDIGRIIAIEKDTYYHEYLVTWYFIGDEETRRDYPPPTNMLHYETDLRKIKLTEKMKDMIMVELL